MKTGYLRKLSLALGLALSFAYGCAQENTATGDASASPARPVTNEVAVPTPAGNSDADRAQPQSPAAVPPDLNPVLPPGIHLGSPLAEVIKLKNAGVDESVMLAFITNSVRLFDLDADQIVYLNDLGFSGHLTTAMIQHDQASKQPAPETAPPAAPAPETEAIAVAPTYVNPPTAEPPAEPQPVPVSYNYFYDTLAPYGNWIEIEGYGRCWQPVVVIGNPHWRPYSDHGRWVYTDAGWYWLSDYTWGATAFHYGRWFCHPRRGWCWWPDTVWAPSWVSWRYSGDYCGWAPLPPTACYQPGFGFSYHGGSVGVSFDFNLGVSAYTFVPWGRFCDSRPYRYCVPPHRVTQIYNQTTIINNYVTGNDNTIINKGIPTDRVRELARTEVRTVNIREAGGATGYGDRRERLDRDGRTLVVQRPQMPSQRVDRASARNNSIGKPADDITAVGSPRLSPEVRPERTAPTRAIDPRARIQPERATPPLANPETSATTPSVVAATSRSEAWATPTRAQLENPAIHGRDTRRSPGINPGTPRKPEASPAPAPVRKVDEPRAIQLPPQTVSRPSAPSPSSSVVVIGGKSGARSSGRDYSVWSTPSPAARLNQSPNSPGPINSAPSPAPTVARVASQPATSTRTEIPQPVLTPPASRQPDMERSIRSRTESRPSHPGFQTPAPAPQVSSPATVTHRPSPPPVTVPAPSYIPRPAPVSVPASPPPARSESRPESGSGQRTR